MNIKALKRIANFYTMRTSNHFAASHRLAGYAFLLTALLPFATVSLSYAEGTRQVAPTPNDIVMLLTNRLDFSNFAAYNGPQDSRLYVSINDPSETIYLGLSGEYNEAGFPFTDQDDSRYRFRIKRFTGTGFDPVVHGPFIVDNTNANANDWTEAQFGEYPVTRTENGQLVYAYTPGEVGEYYIEFQDVGVDGNRKVLIGYWDVTVANNGTVKPGRVWSRNWAFRTPVEDGTNPQECAWDREFNGVLYSYTTDGFVSKIDFRESGFQGLAFTVAFNSNGPGTTGDPGLDRMSIEGANATDNAAEHQIFLNEPDPAVFPDGECGAVSAAPDFQCDQENGFCLPVTVTRPGRVEVILDFDQDGILDPESQDVSLIYDFAGDERSTCIPWDGLKGDSSGVSFGDTIDIILIYTQGVQHWAVYDVEFLKQGFCVEAVRPLCGQDQLISGNLYWDDRNLEPDPSTGQPKDGRSGCSCREDNCRTWTNFEPNTSCDNLNDNLTVGYGDKSTLNTWWFANITAETKADIPLLSCQVTGRDTICEGETTEFLAESTVAREFVAFQWAGPGGFSSTQASTGPISTPGEYTVTVTDNSGCETVCSRLLVVNPKPELNPLGVVSASCETASDGVINVEATGGSGDYSFSIDGSTFQPAASFAGLAPGPYTIVVVDGSGCSDSLAVIVDFEPLPVLSYPDTLTICEGESIQAPPSGGSDLIYQWSPATGVDDPTSPTPVFAPIQTTTYIVQASKTADGVCSVLDTVVVEVIPALDLTISGPTVTCGEAVTLIVTANAPATYTWRTASGEVLATGPELTITVADDFQLFVDADAGNGCTTTEEILLDYAPIDVTIPEEAAACLGEELRINTINNNPEDQLTYSWTPVEAFQPGTANSANPLLVDEAAERTVFVRIENQFGCVYEDSVRTAIIDPNFELGFTTSLQCNGATVDFTNTSVNAVGYLWDFGDPNSDDDTSLEANPQYTYSEPGTYTVTLTIRYDVSCSQSVSQEIVIINPEVIADFTYEVTDCVEEGATIAFTDASTNDFNNTTEWSWEFSTGQTSNEQNPTLLVTESGQLIAKLTINTANNCTAMKTDTINLTIPTLNLMDATICPGASVVLNQGGDPSLEYSWSPSAGLSDPTAASPTASLGQTTTYTVTVQGQEGETCVLTESVTVAVSPPIELTVSDDQETCGEDVTLVAQANVPVTYVWRNRQGAQLGTSNTVTVNPFQEATYFVTATDGNGCTASDSVRVIDQGVDVDVLSPTGDVIGCGPQEIAVEVVNRDPEDILTFNWNPSANVSDPTIPNPIARVESGTVSFFTYIDNQFGCRDSVAFTVTAVAFDPNLPDTVIVCFGENEALTPDANPTYTYEWSPATGLDDPNSSNPLFTGTENTTYTVSVSGASGGVECATVDTVQVIVRPDINLQTSPDTTLCVPTELTLQASSSLAEATFTWFDGPSLDNKIGDGPSITVTPPQGTTLYYVLAEDSEGCTKLDFVEVTLLPVPDFIDEEVRVCAGTPTPLNPDGIPELVYEWQPTTGLDLSEPWNPIVTTDTDITYTVSALDPQNGCLYNGEVEVVANPNLNLQLTPPDTLLCAPGEITLRADTDAPASISWYDNPDFSGQPLSSSRTYTFTPPVGATTLYVLADDGAVCSETASVTVQVNEPFDTGLPPAIAGCPGEPIVIDLLSGLSYAWNPTTGLDLSDPSRVTITLDNDITYEVTVTDQESGCEQTVQLIVEVNPDINLRVSPLETELCEPEQVTLSAQTDGGATYTWYDNPDLSGTPIGVGPNLTVTPGFGLNTYFVRAVGNDDCAQVAVASATVNIIDLVGDSELPDAPSGLCPGESFTLAVNPDFTYVFSPATGVTQPEAGTIEIRADEDVTYEVTISDPETGCEATTALEVVVQDPVSVTITPPETTLCEPEELTFTATTDRQATVRWYFTPDLSGEPAATGDSFTFTPVVGTTFLYATATGADGCAQSDTALARIFVLDPFEGAQLPEGPIEGCLEDEVPLDLDTAFTYTWAPTTNIDLTDPNRPVFTIGAPITYGLTVTDPVTGCTLVRDIQAGPFPPLDLLVNRDIDTLLCGPGTVNLEASTSRPATINWYDSPNFTQPPLGSGNVFPILLQGDTTTFYVQAVSPEGCSENDSITVAVKDLLEESGLGDLPDTTLLVCADTPTPLSLNPAFNYEWDPTEGVDLNDPATPVFTLREDRVYNVTITDPFSQCQDTAQVTIEVNPLINLVASQGDTLCTETEIVLNASTELESTLEWSTDRDFDPVLGTGPELTVTPPRGTTIYYVRATDTTPQGCTAVDSVRVDFYPIDAEASPALACEPVDSLLLEVINNDPAQQLAYMWFPEEAVLSDSTTGPAVWVDPNLSTQYFVDLENQFGCTETLMTSARVINLSDSLDITADPPNILPGESSQLEVTGCTDCAYSWEPAGTLSQDDIANPVATPTETTEYNVIVEQEGCLDTLSVIVTVDPFICGFPYVYLPNTFTPNGDEINDVLYVRGNNITNMRLMVYNRWGQRVFNTEDQNIGWDGTYQDKQLPPDVYGFYLEVQCGNEEVYTFKGNVTLLR